MSADAAAEARLVAAARAGDTRAYGDLVRLHERVAYRLALTIAGESDADEVTQLAFVNAFYALGRFQAGRPFRPWLLRIVANEAKSARRSAARRTRLGRRATAFADPVRLDDQLEQRALRREEDVELEAALRRLPAKHHDVVACRYLLELSEEETAAVLGLRPGTVKSRLSRALDRLRVELEGSAAAPVRAEPARRVA